MITQLYIELDRFLDEDSVHDYDSVGIARDYFNALQRLLPDGVVVFQNGQVEARPDMVATADIIDWRGLQRQVEENIDAILARNEVYRA